MYIARGPHDDAGRCGTASRSSLPLNVWTKVCVVPRCVGSSVRWRPIRRGRAVSQPFFNEIGLSGRTIFTAATRWRDAHWLCSCHVHSLATNRASHGARSHLPSSSQPSGVGTASGDTLGHRQGSATRRAAGCGCRRVAPADRRQLPNHDRGRRAILSGRRSARRPVSHHRQHAGLRPCGASGCVRDG